MDKNRKHQVTLTEQDLSTLAHILRQFTDYMAYDDRPDHGLNNLYGYRDFPEEDKIEIYQLCGKINHAWRKTWK